MKDQEHHELSYDMFVETKKLVSVFLAANAEHKPKDLYEPILAGLVLAIIQHACDTMDISEEEISAKFTMAAVLHQITKNFSGGVQ